jgi:GNAT superfamily N-acetyltransferase
MTEPNYAILELQPGDRKMAKAITARCWPNNERVASHIDGELGMVGAHWYCALFLGRIVGFAGWVPSPCGYRHVGEFIWCNVEPEFQRRGIGSALYMRCEEDMRAAGMAVAVLTTHNPALYAVHGFNVIAPTRTSFYMLKALAE